MTDEPDMTVPVTRGEMHQALETWANVLLDHMAAVQAGLRGEIAATAEHIITQLRAEIGQGIAASAEHIITQVRADNAQLMKSVQDKATTEIRAIDDQYKTLPDRVEKLEDAVFKPKPKRRAKG
jgi:hypothetical protein